LTCTALTEVAVLGISRTDVLSGLKPVDR